MTKNKMMQYVDEICEKEGYTDSPAYDLIYADCVNGRTDEDAKVMIANLLAEYK